MDVPYDEILEVVVSIDNLVDMSLDMVKLNMSKLLNSIRLTFNLKLQDECMLNKLHFSKQVDLGVNYITNQSSTELSAFLSSIPSDIAMFYRSVDIPLPFDLSLCLYILLKW